MKKKIITTCLVFCAITSMAAGHEIVFCGEKIPVDQNFVANKLMGIIKRQINNVKCAELRQRAFQYFPVADYYLKATGLPTDFKYLAIVESGFRQDLVSKVGAAGFWQIMPKTAPDIDLVVNEYRDDRLDINLSTYGACKLLASYYNQIKKTFKVSSWVLTAAAYNFGSGNIFKNIKSQGTNYFSMNLNDETAEYVYRIIAVKELFEYPELYMKDFGFNVFSSAQLPVKNILNTPVIEKAEVGFSSVSMVVKVDPNKQYYPETLEENKIITRPDNNIVKESVTIIPTKEEDIYYLNVQARIIVKNKKKKFEDGDPVQLELVDGLTGSGQSYPKGYKFSGQGWEVDGRIRIDLDLGFDDHDLILYDTEGALPGVAKTLLKDKEPIILRVRDFYHQED